jgi:hypothetical protein
MQEGKKEKKKRCSADASRRDAAISFSKELPRSSSQLLLLEESIHH